MPDYWDRDYSHNQTTDNLYHSVAGRSVSYPDQPNTHQHNNTWLGIETFFLMQLEETQADFFWQFEDGSEITYL